MRATFEEACAAGYVTAEELRAAHETESVAALMQRRRETLANIGWTSEELVEESGRRMRARLIISREEL